MTMPPIKDDSYFNQGHIDALFRVIAERDRDLAAALTEVAVLKARVERLRKLLGEKDSDD